MIYLLIRVLGFVVMCTLIEYFCYTSFAKGLYSLGEYDRNRWYKIGVILNRSIVVVASMSVLDIVYHRQLMFNYIDVILGPFVSMLLALLGIGVMWFVVEVLWEMLLLWDDNIDILKEIVREDLEQQPPVSDIILAHLKFGLRIFILILLSGVAMSFIINHAIFLISKL